jgi:oligopeptide/dipeptide ABC transporter ATP-binding protein
MNQDALVEARDLSVSYHTDRGQVDVVKKVSLKLAPGEAIGIVGESGSGKSTLVRALGGVLPPKNSEITNGSLQVGGRDVTKLSETGWAKLRGNKVGMVFQDPLSFLNPVRRVGAQISEAITAHDPATSVRPRVKELLSLMGLPERVASAYPHELSGGMRQRVLLAIALACRPEVLLADEPTTALDVTTQAEILDLIRNLRLELGMSLILISHDLGVISETCDRVHVMYHGEFIESGTIESVLGKPLHPYTQGLVASSRVARDENGLFATVRGDVVAPHVKIEGCPFRTRCTHAFDACTDHPPAMVMGESTVKCWLREGVPA